MLNKEKFPLQMKEICDRAWRQDYNTTMNSMIEWIVKTVSQDIFFPYFEELEEKISSLEEKLEAKEEDNASDDGRIQKPKRNAKAASEGRGHGS